jgi:hypothetical protein
VTSEEVLMTNGSLVRFTAIGAKELVAGQSVTFWEASEGGELNTGLSMRVPVIRRGYGETRTKAAIDLFRRKYGN